jgi:hypothetical protein
MISQPQAGSLESGSSVNLSSAAQGPSILRRLIMFPIKFFWGMIFCQGLTGSILVVGWTYRLAQRQALKLWFSRSAQPQTRAGLLEFLSSDKITRAQSHWPNWFSQQNFRDEISRQKERGWGAHMLRMGCLLVQSLWANFWIGLRAIANTWTLTLPACVFWWFGWYDGWNNSFNKGYEQAAVGPLVSIIGIAWFITAMFYVPLAQARQAVTGEWRSFYQFRLVWRLVRDRWIYCVMLAILYTLLSIPLSALKTSPMFWMHNSSALASLTSEQVLASLKSYFFWCALVMLPAFVIVHIAAAHIYAAGLISLVQSGRISESELAENERSALLRLGLLAVRPSVERHILVRFISWTGTRLGRTVGAIVLVLIWFGFVAQIYISQFLNYHSGAGWMNQPLIQLPWFRYFPTSAHSPVGDITSALLVLLTAVLARSIIRGLRPKGSDHTPPLPQSN